MTTDTLEITTPSDVEVRFRRTFNAPLDLVWDAFTKPEHITRWMLGPDGWTMPVCEQDFRPGGQWHFAWRKDDGQEMSMTGSYLEVTPKTRYVNTEAWGEDWAETVNTTEFLDEGARTTVVQTLKYPSREARDRAMATGMAHGVDISYDRLESLLPTLT